jgi:hypothetical protein
MNPAEMAHVRAALAQLNEETGLVLTPGAYAKHATLSYRRFRLMEQAIRALRADMRRPLDNVTIDRLDAIIYTLSDGVAPSKLAPDEAATEQAAIAEHEVAADVGGES